MAGGGGGGRIRKSKKIKLDAVRNEINVTPLVDVCLVLLIIFMVVTPMLARGKDVPLPRTANHETENDKAQPIVVIDNEGLIYFDKDPIPHVEEVKERVEAAWRADDSIAGTVLLKADKDLPYKKVYPVIIALHELGLPSIDLGTNEIKEDQ